MRHRGIFDGFSRLRSFPLATQLRGGGSSTLVTNGRLNSEAILIAVQFCSICGLKAADGAQFCSACGQPLSLPKGVSGTKRIRIPIAGAVAALAIVAVLGAIAIAAMMRSTRPQQISPQATGTGLQPQGQMPIAQASPSSTPALPQAAESRPIASANGENAKPTPNAIDVQAVQSALAQLTQKNENISVTPPAQPAQPQTATAATTESDRYPGSQPVNVDNTELPNLGIAVSKEVYSTSDSVSTVIAYYRQRYPEAQVMEVNGQNIVAVDKPGATKVIAIGTSGQETRIAVVRPAN